MTEWIKLAREAVEALKRIADALEARNGESTEMNERLEERDAA